MYFETSNNLNDRPTQDDIRAAVARIALSSYLTGSPKLVEFLRFVVKLTLAGQEERIKEYTIATQALGRDSNFDPATQSIVRVEARRLRQALDRYYLDIGIDDPVRITLPRGTYVPVFSRNGRHTKPNRFAALTERLAAIRWQPTFLNVTGIVIASVVAYGMVDNLFLEHRLTATPLVTGSLARSSPSKPNKPSRFGEPVLNVEAVTIIGTPLIPAIDVTGLRHRLIDAISRFEDITVLSETAPFVTAESPMQAGQSIVPFDYSLAPVLHYQLDGSTQLMFHLISIPASVVVWSGSYDPARLSEDPTHGRNQFIRELMTNLLQPPGVIQSHERRATNADGRDSHYRCILSTFEFWRRFEPKLRDSSRACLKDAIRQDPEFAYGYVLLSKTYLHDYLFETDTPPNILDRALRMAARGVELNPASARAQYVLMDVQIARGQVANGLANGEKAVNLNPYDIRTLIHFGGALIALGDIDKGIKYLQMARRSTMLYPLPLVWPLFVVAYLEGDMGTASAYVDEMMSGDFSLGFLARALVAAKTGNPAGAQKALKQLYALQPAWQSDPQAQLKKFFYAAAILDRFTRDFENVVASQ